jgi:hypothetical protein
MSDDHFCRCTSVNIDGETFTPTFTTFTSTFTTFTPTFTDTERAQAILPCAVATPTTVESEHGERGERPCSPRQQERSLTRGRS